MSESMTGDEVYQPDGSEVQDDAGVLPAEDSLVSRGLDDALDEGYSPPERPWAVDGRTELAGDHHGSGLLEDRLAHELPDVCAPDGDGIGDMPEGEGELWDDEVGAARSGRLVQPDEGSHPDLNSELIASDVGVDGGAASAEEAAMHIVPEGEEAAGLER